MSYARNVMKKFSKTTIEELIKYVMEKANRCYDDDFPIVQIEFWISDFFDKYEAEKNDNMRKM